MLSKIKIWIIKYNDKDLFDKLKIVVFKCDCGLVCKIIKGDKEMNMLLDWNIYSVLRYFFEHKEDVKVYRWKVDDKIGLNIHKIKNIINQVMEQ